MKSSQRYWKKKLYKDNNNKDDRRLKQIEDFIFAIAQIQKLSAGQGLNVSDPYSVLHSHFRQDTGGSLGDSASPSNFTTQVAKSIEKINDNVPPK